MERESLSFSLPLLFFLLLSHWVQWFTHGTRDVTTWKGNIERDQNGFLWKREKERYTWAFFGTLFGWNCPLLFPFNVFLSYSLFLFVHPLSSFNQMYIKGMPSIDVFGKREQRRLRGWGKEGWLTTRERKKNGGRKSEREEGMHGDGAPRKETSVCNPHIGRSTIGPEGGGSWIEKEGGERDRNVLSASIQIFRFRTFRSKYIVSLVLCRSTYPERDTRTNSCRYSWVFPLAWLTHIECVTHSLFLLSSSFFLNISCNFLSLFWCRSNGRERDFAPMKEIDVKIL